MSTLNENELAPIVIDLGAARRKEINESWLRMFGGAIKGILGYMFADAAGPNFKIKGTPAEIKSFANVLNREKQYMETYVDLGLDNPQTYKDKYKLEQAIAKFERRTGIKWPLK